MYLFGLKYDFLWLKLEYFMLKLWFYVILCKNYDFLWLNYGFLRKFLEIFKDVCFYFYNYVIGVILG